ncbi:MAG: hypothetical protein KGL53_16295, partial [Elusimicrobia bacterium]|nr:hypothetical protein [Elusimicrobiota bacterium]
MKALCMAAAACLACAAALSLLAPYSAHAAAFLGVLAAWTAVDVALWRALVRRPAPATSPALDRRVAALVLAVAALMRLILLPLAPTPSTDAYRYSWEGRVTAAGRDPYRLPPDSPVLAYLRRPQDARINHPRLTSVYPPLALAAFALAARASADARAQKTL